tara:strand:+ start:618 stop:761 length:144 start_codon:yes stop_codon:yes gene_type:complete
MTDNESLQRFQFDIPDDATKEEAIELMTKQIMEHTKGNKDNEEEGDT